MSWCRLEIQAICHCNGCNGTLIFISKEIAEKCALWTRFPAFVAKGFLHIFAEISVFTLCRDSDVDGAWEEEI